MKVMQYEIVAALRGPIGAIGNVRRRELADRIEQHGIAPPDGMVLVPKEPTAEMIEAAIKNGAEGDENIILYITSDYKAMLAAAPEAKP